MSLTASSTAGRDVERPNANYLSRDAQYEGWRLAGLSLPCLVLISVLLFAPFAWLSYLSFLEDGSFTVNHYERLTSAIYVRVFFITLEISFVVTAFCVLLGYPLAYFMSQLPTRAANVCLIFVLLPFWTSLLVRTYAWLVLLQRNGVVNHYFQELGLIEAPLRLVHNYTGTVIGMVHVLIPFLVLPLYASMRQIDRDYINAAASLGATPIRLFWQIFFPLSLPGLFAGVVLIFVLCLGFYVTPTLLGGGKVLVWASMIADNVSLYADWGAASALGVVLLIVILFLFYAVRRVINARSLPGTTP